MDVFFQLPVAAVQTAAFATKPEVLAALAQQLAQVYRLDPAAVLDALEERERLGSTGFGRGVAMPHARIDGLRRSVVALLRLDDPCDWGAADGMAVDLVFGLLSPANAGVAHLHALAAISRLVRNPDVHHKLSHAPDSEALYALVRNAVDRAAA